MVAGLSSDKALTLARPHPHPHPSTAHPPPSHGRYPAPCTLHPPPSHGRSIADPCTHIAWLDLTCICMHMYACMCMRAHRMAGSDIGTRSGSRRPPLLWRETHPPAPCTLHPACTLHLILWRETHPPRTLALLTQSHGRPSRRNPLPRRMLNADGLGEG